jgi:predicted  nucleic acid-binding Zn-ribbon protein
MTTPVPTLDDLAARVTDLESKMQGRTARIRDLETLTQTQETRIGALESTCTDLKDRLASIRQRRQSPMRDRIDALETKVAELENDTPGASASSSTLR